nr:hypothetical protein CFP56_54930 [Quercus suber]
MSDHPHFLRHRELGELPLYRGRILVAQKGGLDSNGSVVLRAHDRIHAPPIDEYWEEDMAWMRTMADAYDGGCMKAGSDDMRRGQACIRAPVPEHRCSSVGCLFRMIPRSDPRCPHGQVCWVALSASARSVER